jgi:N-acetylglutamate synthase-like GNAT family acetyltransferase
VIDGEISVVPYAFDEDWDTAKLEDIARYLKQSVLDGGIVIVGIDDEKVIAFGNLEAKQYPHGYVNLPYIHVSRPYRSKHLGHVLFDKLKEGARELGGSKLYISTHPSVDAQAFYESVGCRLATTIIQELLDKEPYDIQLECDL